MSPTLRVVSASLVLVLLGCEDDTSPSAYSLIGSWEAIEIEVVSVADPEVSEELTGQGGSLILELNADASLTLTATFPGESPETFEGTWQASQDILTVRWTEGGFPIELQFDYVLAGDLLTGTGADAVYDFDDDGSDEPATLNVLLMRQ